MVDRLPIKNWAKTLTEDLQLIDQLCEFPIQIAHPRFVLDDTNWLITEIKSSGSATGRRYVDFTVQIPLDESVTKRIIIRIFSPKLPRVEAFRSSSPKCYFARSLMIHQMYLIRAIDMKL